MPNRRTIAALFAGAAVTSACTIPTTTLSNNIAYPFRAQVQNASRPEVHNQYMNLFEAGGGDRHLFIGPVGVPTYDLTLVDGVINHVPDGVRAVIGGEVCDRFSHPSGPAGETDPLPVLGHRPHHQDVHDGPRRRSSSVPAHVWLQSRQRCAPDRVDVRRLAKPTRRWLDLRPLVV